jgi:hypothetical protein
VLRADELRAIMADGDAFSGFEEPMPCFPPSYKRKKGDRDGDCGDYTGMLRRCSLCVVPSMVPMLWGVTLVQLVRCVHALLSAHLRCSKSSVSPLCTVFAINAFVLWHSADPLQIIQGFTNTGEVQELDVSRLSEVEVQQARQKVAAKKLRPPSYTDRVLIHSLPDRQDRLTVQSYDFCDQLRVSDHRAVSMVARLEVSNPPKILA